mmetsp:Transcript_4816/g.6724  ORF Transcript_4816/g.6724 Transcript_4816/m.6724 type:complete len:348 (+) Transcript_4816:1-1044(+)
MNSLLQCLYMNSTFRQSIYDAVPNYQHSELEKQKDIILQLQLLFARMQYGCTTFVDTTDFAASIDLKTSLQQDPQEFFKLFTSLLEEHPSANNQEKFTDNSSVRNLIKTEFQGQYQYVTRCKVCNKTSNNPCQFYELELSIKGNSDLEECLQDYVKVEQLVGDDQYYCDNCQTKQDAERKIEINSLPKVLNLQLLRFVYDKSLGKKKKSRARVSFPYTLDMGPYVTLGQNPEGNTAVYELSAVLIHKGVSAYGGHYIAHVRDEVSRKWWEFDDESVKLQESTLSIPEEEQSNNNDNNTSKKKGGKTATSKDSRVCSSNAYMLIYTQKGKKNHSGSSFTCTSTRSNQT